MQFEAGDELASVIARGVDGARQWQQELDAELAPSRELLERIEQMPTGPEHVAALNELQQMHLDERMRIRATAQWERASSWVQAQKMLSLADATSSLDDDLRKAAVYDISRLSGRSEHSVAAELRRTNVVSDVLGETWVALNAGLLTYSHVLALVDIVKHAPSAVAREVQAVVLPKCLDRRWTPGELGRQAEATLAKVDPEGAEKRRRLAEQHDSDVSFRAEPHGLASLFARGSAVPARQMMDEINRRADEMRRAGDERALNQLRFEALRRAVLDADDEVAAGSDGEAAAPARRPARRPSPRTTALLLVPLSTIVGGDQPGALEGYGPITAQAIREVLQADVAFRRLVFDDATGTPLELGTETYGPSAELRRVVCAFDRTCRVPGCSAPAMHCDIDHEIEWPEGMTTLRNCGLLCRRHHVLKTKKVFDLVSDEQRNVRWISPFGFEWEGRAATYEEFLDARPPDDLSRWLPDPDPPPKERAAS